MYFLVSKNMQEIMQKFHCKKYKVCYNKSCLDFNKYFEICRGRVMANTNDLLNRINSKYSSMSKGQKLLATYITDNYDKAVFLTAAKMGETVGVSESTVVRFAMSLGYKGYPEFQKALEELVRNKLNSVQRMEVTYGRISQSKILESVLQSDADKLKLHWRKSTTMPLNWQ